MAGNVLSLNEPQVDLLIGTWTGIRLQKGANATNLASFADIASLPYVPGQTTYTFTDATGASSDWYRVARYGPAGLLSAFSPAWPVAAVSTTTGDGARRSLKACRRMLGRRLGGFQVATTTADGNTAGTTLISTDLATQLDANRYRGWWIMPTDGVSAGQIRTLGDTALNPADGTLSFNPPMVSQIVQGTQIELARMLPPTELGGMLGLKECLNLALAECWVISREAVVGVSGQATYDLSTLGDWLEPDAISEFLGPILNSALPLQPWGGFTARRDGAVVDLDVGPGIAAGAGMSVELTRPADTLMKVGGVWTDTQGGFVNDTDECLISPSLLVEVALCHAWEALASTTTGAPAARYLKLADTQRTKAAYAKYRSLPHPAERSSHPAVASYGDRSWLGWVR